MNIQNEIKKLRELLGKATPGPWYLLSNLKWNGPLGKMVGHIFSMKPKTEHHSRRYIGYFGFETSWGDALCPDKEGYNSWELPFDENQKLLIESRNALPGLLDFMDEAIKLAKEFMRYDHSEDCYESDDSDFENCTCSLTLARKFLKKHGITEGQGET